MASFFGWLEGTRVALAVRDSLLLTGALSAVHLIGFTLTTGGALIANLNLLGVLFRDRPTIEVSRPARRGIVVGLTISLLTGALLFAARASAAGFNGIFQVKMLLLMAAAMFHLSVHQRVAQEDVVAPWLRYGVGSIGLLLWIGLAAAGCAFILLE
jgi:uncharacterized protein DUF6644